MVFNKYKKFPVTKIGKKRLDTVLKKVILKTEKDYDNKIYENIDSCFNSLNSKDQLILLRGLLSFYLNNRDSVTDKLGPISESEKEHDPAVLVVEDKEKKEKVRKEIDDINTEYDKEHKGHVRVFLAILFMLGISFLSLIGVGSYLILTIFGIIDFFKLLIETFMEHSHKL